MKRSPGLRALAPVLLPAVLAAAVMPGSTPAAAQERPLVSVAPVLGPNWFGHRWELEGDLPVQPADPLDVTLGPTSGLELGLAVEIQPWGRVGLVFSGSWTSMESVRVGTSEDSPGQRNVAGDQSLVRLAGAVRYRIVPQAPGYFSAGVLVNRFTIQNAELVTSQEDRTELGGFGGVGLDFGSGNRHLRAEGRLMVVAPGADPLTPVLGAGTFEPRSVALDYSLSLSLVFGL